MTSSIIHERRRKPPCLSSSTKTIVGVDIRCHHLHIVVSNTTSTKQTQAHLPFDPHWESTTCAVLLRDTIHTLLCQQDFADALLVGIGIGIPCSDDGSQSTEMMENLLIRDHIQHMSHCLNDEFNVPIYLDDHTNMGTIGESHFGVGDGISNMLYVSIGTTIRAGMIINGCLFRGGGHAGALGHMAIDPHGGLCHCGQRGCLIQRAGREAIITTAQHRGSAAFSLNQVITAAKRGEVASLAALEDAGVALGVALANVITVIQPNLIVLNGPAMHAGALLLAPIERGIMAQTNRPIPLVQSTLGDAAVSLGGIAAILTVS
jgi:predicted NBD/HSP70 family sugar kinase